MKNIYTIILLAILSATSVDNCSAQWTPVYQDINIHYGDAAFPTDLTGYVSGFDTIGPLVLQTTDGGINWTKKYITGLDFVQKIAMTDSVTGYLIKGGVPVQVLKTNDGFDTYTIRNLDSSYSVMALELINDSTGFYLNNETRLRKFKHSGTSYYHVFDTLFDGQNLQFVNPQVGFLDNGYRLLMTADSGTTWNYVNNNLGFYCVSFKFGNALNGYFHDGSMIYITNDGGVSFPLQYYFPNPQTIAAKDNFCIVTNNSGDVAYTNDGGVTWQTETTGINFIDPESYVVKNSPDGSCYLFSGNCGEIRKRQPIVTNVSESTIDNDITIFPNPFSAQTTITINKKLLNGKACVFDILGNEILSLDFIGTQISFRNEKLASGIYFVSITDNNKNTIIKKIIVQ